MPHATNQIVEMDERTYHDDPHDMPSLSSHIAHLLVSESPAHAYEAHPRLGGRPFAPTDEMDFGTIGHSILLKSGDSRIKTVVAAADLFVEKELRYRAGEPFRDWTMKAAQKARKEIRAGGGVPVLQRDIDDAIVMATEARRQFKADWLIANPEQCRREVVLLWSERARNGMDVPCRARLDLLSLERGLIEDLKCVASANPKKLTKHIESFGSDIQAAGYTRAVETIVPQLAGRVRFNWTFVSTSRPFCVVRRHPAGSMRLVGETLWARAVDTWAECLDTGVWPGYDDEDQGLEASSFAMARLMGQQEEEGQAA